MGFPIAGTNTAKERSLPYRLAVSSSTLCLSMGCFSLQHLFCRMPDMTYGWEMPVEMYTPRDTPGFPRVTECSGTSGKIR